MKSDMISRIQTKWGKFSKHKLETMRDDLSDLVGMIQMTYGYSKDRAEREFHDFHQSLCPKLHPIVVKPPPQRR